MRRILATTAVFACTLVAITASSHAQTCCSSPAAAVCNPCANSTQVRACSYPQTTNYWVQSTICAPNPCCQPCPTARVVYPVVCSPCQPNRCLNRPVVTSLPYAGCQPVNPVCGMPCQVPAGACFTPTCVPLDLSTAALASPLISPTQPKPCDCASKLSKKELEELQQTYAINPKMSPQQIRQNCEDYCRLAFPDYPCNEECLDNCPRLVDTCDCILVPGPFGEIPVCEVTFQPGQETK